MTACAEKTIDELVRDLVIGAVKDISNNLPEKRPETHEEIAKEAAEIATTVMTITETFLTVMFNNRKSLMRIVLQLWLTKLAKEIKEESEKGRSEV